MKLQGRLKKVEAANLPALRLADIKRIAEEHGEDDANFLASVLCALAARGATLPACDELREMNDRHTEFMHAKTEAELEEMDSPEFVADYSDGMLMAVIMWDVFRWMPDGWRNPGAEARLLGALQDEAEEFAGQSTQQIRAALEVEIERLAGFPN